MTQKCYNFLNKDLLPQPNKILQQFVTNLACSKTYDDYLNLIKNDTASFLKLVAPIEPNISQRSAINGLLAASVPFINPQAKSSALKDSQRYSALLCAKIHANRIITEANDATTASNVTGLWRCKVV